MGKNRRYVALLTLTVALAIPVPAFSETFKLINGAVLCVSDEAMDRWIEAREKDYPDARSALLESGECIYNFRGQIVETSGLRFFFKTVKVEYHGKIWTTEKSNLRVPAPAPGEEER